MKRPSMIAATAAIAVVAAAADAALLLGPAISSANGGETASAPIGSSGQAGSSAGASSGDGASTSGSYADGTYTGAVVSTAKGDVQVSVTVSGGRVTEVVAVKYPDDNPRSTQISQTAIPQLSAEAVDAQSADIQMVSGATETSTGFVGSLQDALNQAV